MVAEWNPAWNEPVHGWEYPATVDSEVVDAGVHAVVMALSSLRPKALGLPGEVLPLRAIVGIVLATTPARTPSATKAGQRQSADKSLEG